MVRVTNTPDCCSGDPLIPEVPRIRFRHVLDRVAKVARCPVGVTWFCMLEPLLEEPGVLAVSTLIQITQMKFVTFVSFVSLVSLVSDVSLCPPAHKKEDYRGTTSIQVCFSLRWAVGMGIKHNYSLLASFALVQKDHSCQAAHLMDQSSLHIR